MAPMAPTSDAMHREGFFEETPAYHVLRDNGVLTTKYRRDTVEDIFTGTDVKANSDAGKNLMEKLKSCYFLPGVGCMLYGSTHIETFVPAGHVGFLMNEYSEHALEERLAAAEEAVINPLSMRAHRADTLALPDASTLTV